MEDHASRFNQTNKGGQHCRAAKYSHDQHMPKTAVCLHCNVFQLTCDLHKRMHSPVLRMLRMLGCACCRACVGGALLERVRLVDGPDGRSGGVLRL